MALSIEVMMGIFMDLVVAATAVRVLIMIRGEPWKQRTAIGDNIRMVNTNQFNILN